MIFPTHLPILMYHQVLPRTNPFFSKHIAVEPEILEGHLKYLTENGWKIETVEEYFSKPKEERNKKVAIMTFDDVSSSFIDYAKPIFDKYGVKASVFPIQNMTAQKEYFNIPKDGIKALTEEEIKFLSEEGFEIGSHAQSHRNLHKIPFQDAVKEMSESKNWLEGLIGKKISTMCFPIGGIDQDLVKAAKEIGFINGLSTFKGSLQLSQDRMSLRRVDIKNFVKGEKFIKSIGPFYGMRRFLTRPFRAKYKVTNRHPDLLNATP